MEIINRTDEFWMEFFDPTDAYEDLYVDEKMIIKGIFDNMGIHHKYVFKFESLEEIYPYIHGRIYAYKNLQEVDFKSRNTTQIHFCNISTVTYKIMEIYI